MLRGAMARFSLPRRLIAALIACFAVAGLVAAVVWNIAFHRALGEVEEAGAAKLSFAVEGLEADIVRYKLHAKTLAETFDPAADADALADLAYRAAAISGAAEIRFLTFGDPVDPATTRALRRAYQGAIGFDYKGAAFVIAAPIRRNDVTTGAVVATVDAAELEWAWRALPETLFFTGAANKIRVASLPGLRGLHLGVSGDRVLPPYQQRTLGDRIAWAFSAAWRPIGVNYDEALFITRPAPVLDMKAHMLVDTRLARSAALTAAAAGGASVFALCLFALVILQRRVAHSQRLEVEAQAMATLEAKVADRTAALTAEVAERRAAETALRSAQDDLVQAGKMSALGAMAAGLAHELNQPLSAIRSFADNARVLLDRSRTAEADENLSRISDLTTRAARIIKNLRAFARNAPEPTGPIDLAPVVDDAIALMAARARVEGVEIRLTKPQTPMTVEGGVVRLQQVLVNLLSNALDAMEAPGAIDVVTAGDGDRVHLSIRDRGDGLSDDVKDRVFDPFFSTKTEAGEGMGLGLSISYGIIRSFGGELRAANHPDGGAIFTIEMKHAQAQEVAA